MAIETPTLTTARLVLRPFDHHDADDIFELQSNGEVLRYWDAPPWSERTQATSFVARCASMVDEGSGVRLAIIERADSRFVGWSTLSSVNPTFRSARLGYCFAQSAWGKGYATEAGQAVVRWAFASLDLNRIQAETDTRHLASARVLEKLGFLREGTLRQDCIVNDVVSDTWVFGLLRDDFGPVVAPDVHSSQHWHGNQSPRSTAS